MKKLLIAFTSLLPILFLCSCYASNSNQGDYTEDFSKFIIENYETVPHKDNETSDSDTFLITLPSGNTASVGVAMIETNTKERDSQITSRYGSDPIVLTTPHSQNSFKSFFMDISTEDLKKDMQYFGDVYISYAKANNLSNDYYLLISMWIEGIVILYDYEREVLYLPKDIDMYKDAYTQFNTIDFDEVSTMPNGSDWLISNDIATSKHGELEIHSPDHYVCHIVDGKFFEMGESTLDSY